MIRLVVIIARKIRSHKLTVVIELKEESSVGLRFDTELGVASVEMQQEFRCVIVIVRSSLMNLYVKKKTDKEMFLINESYFVLVVFYQINRIVYIWFQTEINNTFVKYTSSYK